MEHCYRRRDALAPADRCCSRSEALADVTRPRRSPPPTRTCDSGPGCDSSVVWRAETAALRHGLGCLGSPVLRPPGDSGMPATVASDTLDAQVDPRSAPTGDLDGERQSTARTCTQQPATAAALTRMSTASTRAAVTHPRVRQFAAHGLASDVHLLCQSLALLLTVLVQQPDAQPHTPSAPALPPPPLQRPLPHTTSARRRRTCPSDDRAHPWRAHDPAPRQDERWCLRWEAATASRSVTETSRCPPADCERACRPGES
jgi:hypothetical protein